jgi:hypothetical protein
LCFKAIRPKRDTFLSVDDDKPEPLRPLVRLGWTIAILGASLPISTLIQAKNGGIPPTFLVWLCVETLQGLLAIKVGHLLIRKSPSALIWASFAGGFLMMSALGGAQNFLTEFLESEYRSRMLVEMLAFAPNSSLQFVQVLFCFYFLRVILSSRWHEGLLSSWSGSRLGQCRTSCAVGIAVGAFLLILIRAIGTALSR